MPLPSNVILVHGYSVRSLDAYGILPQLLQNDGVNARQLFLSAYDSLNDDITCDDLALALEARIEALIAGGLDLSTTAVIAHSTGAIVVRRWLLNRWHRGSSLPTHLVTLAGANHGSTLAQLGETQLAHVFRFLDGGTSVGLEVLQDLDYGSPFLLELNEDWLDAYLSAAPPGTLAFSLIGDDHSALINQLFWETHEHGSDCTVRISGGNLNYRMLSIDQTAPHPALSMKELNFTVPHLVLAGISHVGDNGILGGNAGSMQGVYPFVKQALETTTAQEYAAVATDWQNRTLQWCATHAEECNSTIVFSLAHPGGRNIKDSLILIRDHSNGNPDAEVQSALNVSGAMLDRQPIQNNTTPSSVSFYVNYARFTATYPHTVQIKVNSGCDEITYPDATYTVQADQTGSIRRNEVIYVKVTLNRQSKGTYSVIPVSLNPDRARKWPPLPQLAV